MKSVKDYIASIARLFGLDQCVSELSSFAVLIELALILALVILFSLPAVIW